MSNTSEEVDWVQLVYVGRRGSATAWRVFERGGGVVSFIVPIHQLKEVILGMRLERALVGTDSERHDEMRRLLASIGLPSLARQLPGRNVEAIERDQN